MKRLILFIGMLVASSSLLAQPELLLEDYSKRYPQENGIFLNRSEDIEVIFDKQKTLTIETKVTEERFLLNDNAKFYVEDNIHFSHFSNIQDIEATSFIPDAKKFRARQVDDYQTVEEFSDHVFFDDSKMIKFYYPGLVKGSRTRLKYTKKISDPRFFGIFYFSSYLPTEQSTLTLTFPKNVKVSYKEFRTEGIGLRLSKVEKKGKVTYTWEAKNLDKMRSEPSAPSISYFEPHIILFVEEYEVDGMKKGVLGTLDDLYAWYYENVKDVNKEPSKELAKIVDSLLAEPDLSDLEKVEKVYYWVQDNIRYIAIEEGMQGYIPKEASLVCEERYGDCKGMSSIISTMLDIAGVESYMSWVGTNDIPYKYQEVHSPYVDNHMIATYKDGDKVYFLDATSEFLPMGTPSSFIQGKEVLIGKGKDSYEVVVVEDVAMEKNGGLDSIFARFEDGELITEAVTELKGYNNFEIQQKLMNRTGEEREDYLKGLLRIGNNKFQLKDYEVENLGEREKNLRIRYQGKVGDYVTSFEDEIYFNPHLERDLSGLKIDTNNRKYDFERRYRLGLSNHYEFEIPKGYEATYLPENQSFKSEDASFGFEVNYSKSGDKVLFDSQLKVDRRIIRKSEFDEWNRMIKKLNQVYNESIVLRKKDQ
jgi:hypothetical protein